MLWMNKVHKHITLTTGRNEVVAKVIFLHLSVILFTGGVCQGEPPPCQGEPPPTRQTTHPPRTRQIPPREEDCSIRSMSGLYASYWNAFLLRMILPPANEVWGKVMFFHPSVSYSVHVGGGCIPACNGQGGMWPRGMWPGGCDHGGVRSTSGRYASYWNAFLFKIRTHNKRQLVFKFWSTIKYTKGDIVK